MRMLRANQWMYTVLVAALFLQACKKPSKEDIPTVEEKVPRVYVLNEGGFTIGNASVSIYDPVANTITNDLFFNTNGRPMGDVLQSMCLVNEKAYFVMNNSGKIEITNTYPLTSLGVINNLEMPRYMVAVSNEKAYVTEHVAFSSPGRISVIDLGTNTVTGTIALGVSPEKMLLHEGKVYVCISGENKISVINPATDAVESTITVTHGPNSIAKDANGKLWVSCTGNIYDVVPENITAGALEKIDPASGTVENTYTFSNTFGMPSHLTINGAHNTLYYVYDSGVYQHDIGSATLASSPLINRSFYGIGVDPANNNLYAATYGFTSNEKMIRYTSSGTAIDSFTVGVGPNGFVFNY